MTTEITKRTKTDARLKELSLQELIEDCSMSAVNIAESTVELGGLLSEISRRYGHEGINLACETLGLARPLASKLVACYRGVMHPAIAIGTVSHCRQLEKLTIEEQTDIIEKGVPYLEKLGKAHATKRVPLEKLSPKQIAQVFAGDKIRSEDEQFQFLKELAAEPKKEKPVTGHKPDYEVKNGKLVVNRPHKFTLRDLLALTAQL